MSFDFAELVYGTLNGLYAPGYGVSGVENAFAENKPCMNLYHQAFDAYQRLCDRLGVIDEDDDIEITYNSFSEICRIMALHMYHYGVSFSKLTPAQQKCAAQSIIESI